MADSPIRYARKSCGFNQRDFAKKLGISPQHLSDLEAGKRLLSPSMADRLHQALILCGEWYDGSDHSRRQWHVTGAAAAGWDVERAFDAKKAFIAGHLRDLDESYDGYPAAVWIAEQDYEKWKSTDHDEKGQTAND